MKAIPVYIMASLYFLAGLNHFINPGFYLPIMPPWLPEHDLLISLSGIAEMAFGILLVPVKTRRVASYLIILLLIAIFPANVQMLLNYEGKGTLYLLLSIVRLPVQLVLIWWAWKIGKIKNR